MVGIGEDMSTEGAGAEGHTEWAGTYVELVVGSDMGGAGKDMWVADVDVAGTVGAWVQKQPRAFFLAHSELARGPCFVVALLPFVSSTLPNSSRGAHYQSQSPLIVPVYGPSFERWSFFSLVAIVSFASLRNLCVHVCTLTRTFTKDLSFSP